MKPHRIRMTHNLLLNYGLYRKMEIYVSRLHFLPGSKYMQSMLRNVSCVYKYIGSYLYFNNFRAMLCILNRF